MSLRPDLYRPFWRRLVTAARAIVDDPASDPRDLRHLGSEGAQQVIPVADPELQHTFAAFARLAWAVGKQSTQHRRAQLTAALASLAGLVAELLDQTEPPPPPAAREGARKDIFD